MTYKNAAKTVAKKRYARRAALFDVNCLFLRAAVICAKQSRVQTVMQIMYLCKDDGNLFCTILAKPLTLQPVLPHCHGACGSLFAEMRLKTRLYN